MEKIFNLTLNQFEKQTAKRVYAVDPQCDERPIKKEENLEACLRGSEKILNDSKMRTRVHDVLRRA